MLKQHSNNDVPNMTHKRKMYVCFLFFSLNHCCCETALQVLFSLFAVPRFAKNDFHSIKMCDTRHLHIKQNSCFKWVVDIIQYTLFGMNILLQSPLHITGPQNLKPGGKKKVKPGGKYFKLL